MVKTKIIENTYAQSERSKIKLVIDIIMIQVFEQDVKKFLRWSVKDWIVGVTVSNLCFLNFPLLPFQLIQRLSDVPMLKQHILCLFSLFDLSPSRLLSWMPFASVLIWLISFALWSKFSTSVVPFPVEHKATWLASLGAETYCSGDAGAILLWFTSLEWEFVPACLQNMIRTVPFTSCIYNWDKFCLGE